MQPYKVEIYLYAESEAEAQEAKKAAYDFVANNYNKGVLVTARKFTEIIRKWGDNPIVRNFIKK
jgi:hypothetical protein